MYFHFYGLNKEPFHNTPDPEFLYLSESHKEALGSIIHGVTKRKGFIAVTGHIGVGKTTIVRSYLQFYRDSHLKPIYVFNPDVSFKELLKVIYRELGLDMEDGEGVADLVDRLHSVLIDEHKAGNVVALIVDEAQGMPIETLEKLRMLSNVEMVKNKLIQIVLVGQAQLDDLLDRPELLQFKQRIAVRTAINHLTDKESYDYIRHRLDKAGLRSDPIFEDAALRLIVREAKGIPRTINILCENALVSGFAYQKKPVSRSIVREVIADFKGTKRFDRSFPFPLPSWKQGVLLTCGAVACFLLGAYGGALRSGQIGLFSSPRQDTVIATAPVRSTVEAPLLSVPAAPNPVQSPLSATVTRQDVPATQSTGGVVYKVQPGDKLLHLLREMYDASDRKRYGMQELVRIVRQANPGLPNSNRLVKGKEIVFPKLSEISTEAEEKK